MITSSALEYIEEAARLGNEALSAASLAEAEILLRSMASALEKAKLLVQQHDTHSDGQAHPHMH
jgi:hypothetical protein